jgi:hypothetical protein
MKQKQPNKGVKTNNNILAYKGFKRLIPKEGLCLEVVLKYKAEAHTQTGHSFFVKDDTVNTKWA